MMGASIRRILARIGRSVNLALDNVDAWKETSFHSRRVFVQPLMAGARTFADPETYSKQMQDIGGASPGVRRWGDPQWE